MEHARFRNPPCRQSLNSGPVGPVLLAATAESPPPEPSHPLAKYSEAVGISRYRVIVEVALHHRLEPLSGLLRGIVHSLSELMPDRLQLRPHALAAGLALHRKRPIPVLPADVREAQKVERLGLSFPSSFPAIFGEPPELDPARFVWMEFQSKLPQPFPKVL